MRCPYCHHREDKVVDSREGKDGNAIRRRRECLSCRRRFTTYERSEAIPFMVVKRAGVREPFDRSKLSSGLLKACEKRPVNARQLEKILEAVEQRFQGTPDRELTSKEIGQYVMERLKELDKVAYLRFTSVFMDFSDVREFLTEVEQLLESN